MELKLFKTGLPEIQPLRNLFLQENNFQVRYNAVHERNRSDSYLLFLDDLKIGYGSIKGKEEAVDRDTIFEFFIIPSFRKLSSLFFAKLIAVTRVKFIECQGNDILLSSMLYAFSHNIQSDVILFKDDTTTEHVIPDVIFRPRNETDNIFDHKNEPVGEYILAKDGLVVATGGFLLHYNMPFADLYMEVMTDHRREGLGAFLIQELKKECYLSGRVPAARCDMQNNASKATLLKAGLKIAGFMLTGDIKG